MDGAIPFYILLDVRFKESKNTISVKYYYL